MSPAAVPSQVFGPRQGTVATFDDHVGAGTVRDDDGRTWWFHCTRIAGGERTVAVDAPVHYTVRPGPNGLEAVDVAPRRAAHRD